MIGLMADESVKGMLGLATDLSRQATALVLAQVGKTKVTRKADSSVVTETDHAIEARVLAAIAKEYPGHAVCAEETASHTDGNRAEARYCWVIDPLDGTRNYASGLPCFCTSIAVLDRGWPIIAVVLEHNLGHLYSATKGGGAMLNDAPIHAPEVEQEEDTLVGIPSSKDQLTVSVLQCWTATPGLVCRNFGTTALHLGLVASGALRAAFCKRCKIWDSAAGALLVTEAGGRITDPFGRPYLPFDLRADPSTDLPYLAATPNTHRRLLESIRAITG